MLFLIWVLLWIFAALPVLTITKKLIEKFKKERFRRDWYEEDWSGIASFFRFILTLIIFGILAWSCVPDAIMWWIWIGWFLFWTMIEAFAIDIHHLITILSIFSLIGILVASFVVMGLASYHNALYFDSFIQKAEGFPIENEVPDNLLRLTTKELAQTIAAQYMAELGGALKIVDMQVTLYQGRLVWVAVIARQEAWGTTYKTEGLVIVDANNPDKKPEILKESFAVAQGLDFNPIIGAWGSATAKGYYGIDTSISIGDTYPVLTPEGKWQMAMTSYVVDWLGVRHYNGIYLLDQQGNIIAHYKDEIPNWLIQPFDEESFLEGGIAAWGGHKRGDGFDLFAGGFLWIPPSPDRLAISEDTRYVYDPDTGQVVALIMIHSVREKGELSLAGAFKVTSKGIFYYDLKGYNLMSGNAASGIIQSKITARTGTRYFTAMELIYPLKVKNETKFVWFIPVYFENLETHQIGLAGLGLVDAQAADKVIIEYTGEGITGPTLIKKAKESFRALYGEKVVPETRQVTGKVLEIYPPYIKNGNTHQWILLETSKGERLEVLLNTEILSDEEWLKIQKLKIGDTLT